MLYVLVRGPERRSYELRLGAEEGFELIVRDEYGQESVEQFTSLERAIAREHELLREWCAVGWKPPGVRRR